MHLAHHRDTNNPDLDPDNWVAVEGPFKVLFRCLTIGLRPDMPSDDGVISRVVEDFAIHRRA